MFGHKKRWRLLPKKTQMNKPIVTYRDCGPTLIIGHRADVMLHDGWYKTSRVASFTHTPNGPIIETQNTYYVPPNNGPEEPYSERDSKPKEITHA
jgi:hypothetical protein